MGRPRSPGPVRTAKQAKPGNRQHAALRACRSTSLRIVGRSATGLTTTFRAATRPSTSRRPVSPSRSTRPPARTLSRANGGRSSWISWAPIPTLGPKGKIPRRQPSAISGEVSKPTRPACARTNDCGTRTCGPAFTWGIPARDGSSSTSLLSNRERTLLRSGWPIAEPRSLSTRRASWKSRPRSAALKTTGPLPFRMWKPRKRRWTFPMIWLHEPTTEA